MKTRLNYPIVFGMILTTVLMTGIRSEAKVVYAKSCAFLDVSNAVMQASPGDVVQLPAGTNAWTENLILTNGVSLNGAGTNSTVLIDEENRSGNAQMIVLYAAAGYLSEVSNIQFAGGVTNTSVNYFGAIAAYGFAGSSWRIDHNVFYRLYAKNIATYGNSFSVIDHNTFYERIISIEANGYLPGDYEGDASWASPATYGLNSSNCLYVENNFFTNTATSVASVGACDGENGARIVFRYNIIWNDCFNNHGTETGGRSRSERSFEIYNNTFTCPSSATLFYPIYTACMIRGGSGVIFSNTINGYQSLAAIRNYRYTCAYYSEWEPFGGANGLSPYDSNSPTLYLTGKSAGTNGSSYLQVSGANWTPNQWIGYTLIDTNSGIFSLITSNTVNTAYFIGSPGGSSSVVPCTLLTFNAGDGFQFRRVFAALDQPGRGSGDLLQDEGVQSSVATILSDFPYFAAFPWLVNQILGTSGMLLTINTTTGTASWPRQALDGVYSWGNTMNGAPVELATWYPTLQSGRDFFNETPKPGYTPFSYPHPLTFSTNSWQTNGTPPQTNSTPPQTNNPPPVTTNLLPPLYFHVNP